MGKSEHTRSKHMLRVAVIAAGVVVLMIVAYCVGHAFGKSGKVSPRIISGVKQEVRSKSGSTPSPPISKCIDICKATKSVGIDVSSGMCLNDNLSGYACAVVVSDHGHCPSYFSGRSEVVLNTDCESIGVYRYKEKGGES